MSAIFKKIHTKIALAFFIVIIIVVGIALTWPDKLYNARASDAVNQKYDDGTGSLLSPLSEISNKEDKVQRNKLKTENNPHHKLFLISNAARQIIKNLEIDEASRSEVLKEEENDEKYIYAFKISPRSDFENYLESMAEEQAAKLGVDARAVLYEIRHKTDEFRIPQGMERKIMINVFKDGSRDIQCMSGFQPEGQLEDVNGNISFSGHTAVSTVSPNVKHWRYRHLLDLRGEGNN